MSLGKYLAPLNSVALFDPGIATRNAGDEIIAEAALAEVARLFPTAFVARVPTHERLGPRSWRLAHQAHTRIVAGSNILGPRMVFDRQWRIRPWDMVAVRGLRLLAAGWRGDDEARYPLSDRMLRGLLTRDGLHSVRDGQTLRCLADRGIRNVVNTGCVTMWRLDTDRLAALPVTLAPSAVTTINAGRRHPADDAVLDMLLARYRLVWLWPQGIDDLPLAQDLALRHPRLRLVGPTLSAYDALLRGEQVDFVGNRLHGGIRALQHGRRALILGVDNRAREIARDTGLPVQEIAQGADALAARLDAPQPIQITLPRAGIARWRAQFAEDQGLVPAGTGSPVSG
ncbi:MAG: polysaccharide pyruvyl transferase family protein [Rhodobacteraceae bacterium]|nr:polysaccharide pyruvyl transferase family protein [Paracoccaceae bacterium]